MGLTRHDAAALREAARELDATFRDAIVDFLLSLWLKESARRGEAKDPEIMRVGIGLLVDAAREEAVHPASDADR